MTRIAAELRARRTPNPSRPTVWLTSNGLSNDRLKAEFVRLVVMRKRRCALDPVDCDGRPAHTSAHISTQPPKVSRSRALVRPPMRPAAVRSLCCRLRSSTS